MVVPIRLTVILLIAPSIVRLLQSIGVQSGIIGLSHELGPAIPINIKYVLILTFLAPFLIYFQQSSFLILLLF